MKRFFADAIFICILVSIGSYINQSNSQNTSEIIRTQVEDFEADVAQNHIIGSLNHPVELKDIEDNRASRLAKGSSEVIVSVMKGCVQLFSDVFEGMLQ